MLRMLLLFPISFAGCAVGVALLGAADAESKRRPQAKLPGADSWTDEMVELVENHCLDCHNADYQEAEVDLSTYRDPAKMGEDARLWQRALDMIRFGAMPPEDAEPLAPVDQQRLGDAIDDVLYSAACDQTPKPGKVTVRRLNRSEYNNTVSDLFGIPLTVADGFPADEVGAGFDNNGDVLSIPPMLFEKYMSAAEEIAEKVIFDPDTVDKSPIPRASDQILTVGNAWVGSFTGHFMEAESFAWTEVELEYEGEYRIDVRGGAAKKETEIRIGTFDADGILRGVGQYKYFGGGGGGQNQSFSIELPAGKHRFLFAQLDPDAEVEVGKTKFPGLDRLTEKELQAGRKRIGGKLKIDRSAPDQDVTWLVRSFQIRGPKQTPERLYPVSHRELVRAKPREGKPVRKAAFECLQPFLRRAFRGPVDDQTVDRYARLVDQAHRREKSFERALRVGVAAALVSPRFLFRSELPAPDHKVDAQAVVPLTDHQLASRLSYFLWSSMPDEPLLDLADEGKLQDEQVLKGEVKRMLADPKAERLADNFAAQWLGLRNLDGVTPDPESFPDFDEDLRNAMRQETLLLFLDCLHENRPVTTLLDSSETFVNERLAKHYGIEGIDGDAFRRVSVRDAGRAGILTHASVLTLTSYPGRTSPVLRGKWVLENILGTKPPEPPPGVPELEESEASNLNATLREQLQAHRADPACASCHRVMDDLGFGFEHFGATGKRRSKDAGQPIDASGALPGGQPFNGALSLVEKLRETASDAFVNTVVRRLLTFAIGRELNPADRCFVADIMAQSAESDHRFVELTTAVVLSQPFRFHTLHGE